MSPKNENILEAAMRVFARYGVKRTTMNDIAEEAGLVRQTVYTAYKSKDAVLRGVIEHWSQQTIAGIRSAWDHVENIDEKFDIYFEFAILNAYRLIQASPDMVELQEGFNTAGKEAVCKMNKDQAALLEEALVPFEIAISGRGTTVEEFAEFIQISAINLKHCAENEAHLQRLYAGLRASVLAVTAQK